MICAAARANLDALSEERAGARAISSGEHLVAGLERLMLETSSIAEVRGAGLMVAFDLIEPSAVQLVDQALADGFVLNSTSANTVRLLPPLCCTTVEIDQLLEYLRPAITEGKR